MTEVIGHLSAEGVLSEPSQPSSPHGEAAPARSPVRSGRYVVITALAVLLVTVSLVVLGAARQMSVVSGTARQAIMISEAYRSVELALAEEQAIGHGYRLAPSEALRVQLASKVRIVGSSLGSVSEWGHAVDRAGAAWLLDQHQSAVIAMNELFAAVDAGDYTRAERIDIGQIEPIMDRLQSAVSEQIGAQRRMAGDALALLNRYEPIGTWGIPVVLGLAALLLVFNLILVRRYQRRIVAQAKQAEHDGLHDGLTGLPNRLLLADRLKHALRAGWRDDGSVGLLLIDLDRFKEINDTLGHHHGDRLLVKVGERLVGELRGVDTVARLGGDEFAVLLPGVDGLDTAVDVAVRLSEALDEPFQVEGVELNIEASIGVVVSGMHGDEPSILMQRADVAMYVAKDRKLGVFGYAAEADGHSPARLALLGDLRRAINQDELVLHYQPKVDIASGQVVGVEALIRWLHRDKGTIAPGDFIPLAERTGLIGPLTLYVLDLALAQARRWIDGDTPLPVAVNLSTRNLLDERLPDQVAALLASYGVPAEMLKLEVTESAVMIDPTRSRRVLLALRELGVGVSVDDFGVGFTSLAQLRGMPFTELKVDRSFVTSMDADRSNALIVNSVIDLSHNLGMTAVAEGVETAEVLDALAAAGCDFAQGYHLSRPLPVEEFDRWYADQLAGRTPVRLSEVR